MAPQSVARGTPRKRGSGSGGDARARQSIHGAPAARYGVASSLEDTAPPCAVAPFASSPFAHPIPQSHRRASEDLFSASLEYKILRFSSPAGKEPGWGCELGFFS